MAAKVSRPRFRAAVLPDRKRETLHVHIGTLVEPGSTLYSDEYSGYTGLECDYAHKTVNHAVEYVSGRVYTNGIQKLLGTLQARPQGHLRLPAGIPHVLLPG